METDPPDLATRSWWKTLAASVVIRRPEFLVAEIPIIAIPTFLVSAGGALTLDVNYGLGVLLFFLLFNFGDMINCLQDRDLDSVYKKHLSRAVDLLGPRNVRCQIYVTIVIVICVAAYLTFSMDRWLILPLVIVGLILGSQYSAGPIHFKRRGLWHLVSLWAIIFFGPMVLIGQLITPEMSLRFLILVSLYGLLQMGTILINTAEDYPEDLAAGMRNTIVALGLRKGILFSAGLITSSGVAYLFMFHHLLAPLVGAERICFSITALVILFVAISAWRLSASISRMNLEDAVARVKKDAKLVPLWLTIVAWSSLGLSYLYYRQSF